MTNGMLIIQENHRVDPLISVILPVYNGEAYLTGAIDSILAQTITDFELLILDDGSTDQSLPILRKYQALDKRVVLVSRENRNLVATLNELVDLARGKWVARMDADDISLPYRFEMQLRWLEKTGADICGSWVKCFGGGNRHTRRMYESDQAIKMDMLFKSPFTHPSVMMRTSLVRQLRYDKSFEKAEDYDLWVRAAQAGWTMTNVPEVLLMYRIHGAQITSKASVVQQSVSGLIKARYWAHTSKLLSIQPKCIGHVVNLMCLNANPSPRLEMVNRVFRVLLDLNSGEARQALVDNICRVYLKAAAAHPDIGQRWRELTAQGTIKGASGMRLKLWLATTFKLQAGSKIYGAAKKVYNYLFK